MRRRHITRGAVAALAITVPPTTVAAAAEPLTPVPLAGHPSVRAQMRDAARELRDARQDRREARRRRMYARVAVPAALESIAACESGGNPRAIGGGGAYRGKYQFDYGTWASVGGKGDPAAAPEAEQDMRAAMLYARSGASPWPVCG